MAKQSHPLANPHLRFREIRIASGLSQSDAARQLGITPPALCQIEMGRRLPGRDLAVRMQEQFGMPVAAWSVAA